MNVYKVALVLVKLALLLFAGILLYILFIFDINDYKHQIAAHIAESTGRTVDIKGDIELTVYPWLGAKTGRIVLGGDERNKQPIFQADKIAVRIKTVPILRGRYEFDVLDLQGVEINLFKDRLAAEQPDNPVSELEDLAVQEISPLPLIILGGVDISDSRFVWTDKTTDQVIKISEINARTGQFSPGQPVPLEMSFVIESTRPDLRAELKMQATSNYDPDAGIYDLKPIAITAQLSGEDIPAGKEKIEFNTNITFNLKESSLSLENFSLSILDIVIETQLTASNLDSTEPDMKGQISVIGNNLGTLFKVLGKAGLASYLDRRRDQAFSLQAGFDIDLERERVVIPEFQTQLAGAAINGYFQADQIGSDEMLMDLQLKAAGPDLPALIRIAGQFTGEASMLNNYGKKLASLSAPGFNIDVELNLDSVAGKIELEILSAEALGVVMNGGLKGSNISDDKGSIDGKLLLNTKTGALPDLLSALGRDTLAKSLKSADAEIKFSGNSEDLQLKPAQIRLQFLDGKPANTLIVGADTRLNIDAETLSSDIDIGGLGMGIKAAISAREIISGIGYSGEINVAEFSPRKFMRQIKIPPPPTADDEALNKIAMQAKFSGTSNSIDLQPISLSLDGTKLEADLSANKKSARPELNANIAVDDINIDRYLPPSSAAGTATKANKANKSFSLPQGPNVKAKLKIGRLVFAGLQLRDIHLGVDMNNDLLKLEPVNMNLYEGSHQGYIKVDAAEKPPKFELESRLDKLQLEPLIKDYTQVKISSLAGLANIDARLSSAGNDVAQLKNNLNGRAGFSMTQGLLRFVDAGETARKVIALMLNQPPGPGQGEVMFPQLDASFNILDGVIKNNDLLLQSPHFEVKGGVDGRVTVANLPAHIIDYDLHLNIFDNSGGQRSVAYNIPIKCRGSLDVSASTCRPDYATVIGSTAVKLIEGGLEDGLKGAIRKLIPGKNESGNKTPEQPEQPEQPPASGDPLEQLIEKGIDKVFDKLF